MGGDSMILGDPYAAYVIGAYSLVLLGVAVLAWWIQRREREVRHQIDTVRNARTNNNQTLQRAA